MIHCIRIFLTRIRAYSKLIVLLWLTAGVNSAFAQSQAVDPAIKIILSYMLADEGLQKVDIQAGANHTCALLMNTQVTCWGANEHGQLGNATVSPSSIPVYVRDITNAVSITTGSHHSCALLSNGSIKCWGNNQAGTLGDGSRTHSAIPVNVTGISNATAIDASGSRTCALLSTGEVNCWGVNSYGQLGNGGSNRIETTPVTVTGINNATAIAAGERTTCASLVTGEVKCWGINDFGQLGNGSLPSHVTTPVTVTGINNATAVAAGYDHVCALLSTGRVKCWGYNDQGQIGNDHVMFARELDPYPLLGETYIYSKIPVTVNTITNATSITAGNYYSCARLVNGKVRCWGANENGQLGNGTEADEIDPGSVFSISPVIPVQVSGIINATTISAGSRHTCARLYLGEAMCWGSNFYGELGNATTINSSIPVPVL